MNIASSVFLRPFAVHHFSIVIPLIILAALTGCSRDIDPELSRHREGAIRTTADTAVVIMNVNVVPMTDDTVLTDHAVVVEDGVITMVAPTAAVTVPVGTRHIDGGGRYLIPGLADMHIHLRSTGELLSYLAYGVTSVLHMSGPMGDAPDLLQYREALESGELVGPTLYTTGPILDGDPPIFASVSRVVTRPAEAREAVADQHEAGFDFIKVYNNLMPNVLEAVVEAARERGMAVVGHIPRTAGRTEALQRGLAAGLDMIAHGEEFFFTLAYTGVDSLLDRGEVPYRDDASIDEAVELTKAADAAVTPNLSFVRMTRRQLDDLQDVLEDPDAEYLDPDVLQMWKEQNPTTRSDLDRFDLREQAKLLFVQKLTEALQQAGVPLLVGSDASAPGMYPGASAHLELRELVLAGLTPYEALAAGTRNAGHFVTDHVERAQPFGLIVPGYRADLVLINGNPLEDVERTAQIYGVMARGQWYDRDELDRMRAARVQ